MLCVSEGPGEEGFIVSGWLLGALLFLRPFPRIYRGCAVGCLGPTCSVNHDKDLFGLLLTRLFRRHIAALLLFASLLSGFHLLVDLGDDLVCALLLQGLSQVFLHLLRPLANLGRLLPLGAENIEQVTAALALDGLHHFIHPLVASERLI